MKLSIGISRFMLLAATTFVLVVTTTTTATAFRYSQTKTKVHVLVYETEQDGDSPSQRLVEQINKDSIRGIHATLFGQSNTGFTGYGSKFSAVLPLLRQISNLEDDNSLVVLSDSRDVLVNNPYNDHTYNGVLVDEFQVAFEELTALTPNAVVISAEAQCCVSALTHVPLGGYYNFDGSRKATACSSGTAGCLWAGDEKAVPWENFMMNRMLEHSHGVKYDDAYLNAGLMVGRAKDLLRVISAAQINDKEDDQAVWTDYMYHHPNDIVLDYQQRLFGNNRGGIASMETGGCVFELQPGSKRLVHVMTNSVPLFLHSPGAFFACHDQMATALNVPQVAATIRRKLVSQDKQRRLQCNYGRNIDGTACVDDTTGGGLLGYLNRTNTTDSTSGGGLLDYLNHNDTSSSSNTSLIGILSSERNATSAPYASPLSPFAASLTNTSGTSSSGGSLSDFLESSRDNSTSTENTTSLADIFGGSNTSTPTTTTTSLADILGASNTTTPTSTTTSLADILGASNTSTTTTSLADILGASNTTTQDTNTTSLADILASTNNVTTPTANTTTTSLLDILGGSSNSSDTTNTTAPSDLASFLSSTSSNTTTTDTSNVFSFFNSTTSTSSTTNATAPSSLSNFLSGSAGTNTTTTSTAETDDGYSDDSVPTDTSTVATTVPNGISDDLSNALGEARNQGIRPTGRRRLGLF